MPILNRTKQTFCIKGISFCVLNTGVLARHFRHRVWQISFIYVVCASTSILSGDQEYERAVIFRLGRLLSGGARGPGVFFIIPCVDIYEKIDMRVQNFDVPPQEVRLSFYRVSEKGLCLKSWLRNDLSTILFSIKWMKRRIYDILFFTSGRISGTSLEKCQERIFWN